MSVWFLLPPDCQSRPCCLAGYMTLSVPTRIMMEIIRKARQRLLHRFFRSRSRSTEMGITYLPPCQPQIIFLLPVLEELFQFRSEMHLCARESAKIRKSTLAPLHFSTCTLFSRKISASLSPLAFLSTLPNWIAAGPGLSLEKNKYLTKRRNPPICYNQSEHSRNLSFHQKFLLVWNFHKDMNPTGGQLQNNNHNSFGEGE